MILAGIAYNFHINGNEITLGEHRGLLKNNKIDWSNGSTWERTQVKKFKQIKNKLFQNIAMFQAPGGSLGAGKGGGMPKGYCGPIGGLY